MSMITDEARWWLDETSSQLLDAENPIWLRNKATELIALARSLLPARDVAVAAVKLDSIAKEICQKPAAPGPPWISDFDAAQEVYDAALARYAAAEDKP